MTEEYKEQLLNYVTGNLENTTPTTDEIFKEINEKDRLDWLQYMPTRWSNMRVEGVISPNETNSGIGVLYGGYYYPNLDDAYGFIILVDSNLNPLKIFFETDTGMKLRYIQKMGVDEQNRFFAVTDTYFSFDYIDHNYATMPNHTLKFLLFNNFTIKQNDDYTLKLRNSYNFTDNNFHCKNIKKSSTSAKYLMIGDYLYQDDSRYFLGRLKTIELTINVGQANDWVINTATDKTPSASIISFDDNDNYSYSIIYGVSNDSGNTHKFFRRNYNGTFSSRDIQSFNYFAYWINDKLMNQAVFLNENEVYFVLTNQNATTLQTHFHLGFYKYNYTNSQLTTIYENDYGQGTYMNWYETIYVTTNQGKVYIEYNNNIDNTNYKANYYIQRLENDIWSPILLSENINFVTSQRILFVKSNFNLLQYFLIPTNFRKPTWYMLNVNEIYNPNQYNGEPYINSDVFSPLYSNLYSNGSLVFSRNLYNISKQNNMTMSSVEIPNNYLNDITIEQNDLISETNFQMNSDNTQWTKNIYEVVDLNFLNTITIEDEDTNTPYLESAIKLNNSITDGGDTNYQNTPCNKYRINYTDSTNIINSLYWENIDDTHKETEITFYVDKNITSIDLISNDETTIYLTLPVEVEVGKYYTINQKIKIQ